MIELDVRCFEQGKSHFLSTFCRFRSQACWRRGRAPQRFLRRPMQVMGRAICGRVLCIFASAGIP